VLLGLEVTDSVKVCVLSYPDHIRVTSCSHQVQDGKGRELYEQVKVVRVFGPAHRYVCHAPGDCVWKLVLLVDPLLWYELLSL